MSEAERIEVLFDRLVELQSEQARQRFIDEACHGDPELRAKLERLMVAHRDAGSFLDDVETTDMMANSAKHDLVGATIGPYKLREVIGEGGMGTVYVAEQETPIRRKVALKVIKPGMDSNAVIARFEAERQALALMDHPNIARVLDAGTTNAGRPYFVMELVKGIPLVDYCDQQRLATTERLALFVTVCQAVQHAHSKGVIHRDLKPSNILVAPHDGRPIVKVIDFGLAKAISQQLTDKSIYTRFSQMIGTPLYMSPEQAELNALDVDTRSDIYSLGVLLYELLTGTTPFDRQRFASAAFDEIRKIIREEEPPQPSTRLTSTQGSLPHVSERHRCNAAKLLATVKGDLDWIVMKCLEKERARRYDTASSLAADVQNFLADEPVSARPPSAVYRFSKFARRHRTLLLTGISITAILVVATTVSGVLAALAWQGWNTATEKEQLVRYEKERNGELLDSEREKTYRLLMARGFGALAHGDLNLLSATLVSVAQHTPSARQSFEYRLLQRQLSKHEPEFTCHEELQATCVSFSPTGDRLLVGSSSDKIHVFRTADWSEASSISVEVAGDVNWSSTTSIEPRLNGRGYWILGTLEDGTGVLATMSRESITPLIVYSTTCLLTDVAEVDGTILLGTANGEVRALTLTGEKVNTAWTVKFDKPNLEGSPLAQEVPIEQDVRLTTNGKWVVASNTWRTIKILDARTGEPILTSEFEEKVTAPQFLGNSNRFAIVHRLGFDILAVEGQTLVREQRIPYRCGYVAISPGGKEIAAADATGAIRFVDVATTRILNRVVQTGGVDPIAQVSYSHDGSWVAGVDDFGGLKVWRRDVIDPPTRVGPIDAQSFQFVAVSPVRQQVAVWGQDRHSVWLWNPIDGREEKLGAHKHVLGMAFSPDGTQLATCGGDRCLRIWDIETKTAVRELETERSLWAVAFSPDTTNVAFAGRDGVSLWNYKTNRVRRLTGHVPTFAFLSVDFSHDGRYLVAGGGEWTYNAATNQGQSVVWDLTRDDNVCLRENRHRQIVYAVDFNPTSYDYAAGGLDGIVEVRDVTNALKGRLDDKSPWVTGLSFYPDGSRLATVSPEQITLFEFDTLKEIATFRVNEQFRRVAFFPNGDGMITASAEGFTRYWEASSSRSSISPLPKREKNGP